MASPIEGRFGPYLILGRLGGGGMGEVYRARDERLDRDVALKLLRTDVASEMDPQRRFAHEARAAGALNHPNILTVHDVGMENGAPYIVTELVDGESLDKVLAVGAMPLGRVLDIAVQVTAGLVAAHGAGIVHRDLKPANLMLTRAGLVKILDFGLAKRVTSPGVITGDHTNAGMVLGTASYMSPEQARGEAVDFRSDQFSLGLILYEMACGKRAFDRSSPISTLSAIIEDDFEPLAAVKPTLPVPLRWLIERCLRKDRESRYADTRDLHQELQTIRERIGELAPVIPAAEMPRPRRRLRTTLATSAAGLVVALLAGFAGLSVMPSGLVDLNAYRVTPLATEGTFEGEPAWSPDGKNLAYAGEVDSVRQIFVRRFGSPVAAQLTRLAVDCDRPFWSADGTRVYYLSPTESSWSLWSIGATGGAPEMVQPEVSAAALSSDGRTLAFLRSKPSAGEPLSLWLAAGSGSTPQQYKAGPFSAASFRGGQISFTPDGKALGAWLSHSNGKSEFWMLPVPSGDPIRSLELPQEAQSFHWMPDGRRIVFGGRMPGSTGADLHVADTRTQIIRPLTKTNSEAIDPAPSPDGTRIAYTAAHADFDLVEIAADGSAPRNLLASSRNESYPAWSPAGTQYAFTTDRAGPPQIWIKSRAEGWVRPLVTEADFGNSWIGSFEGLSFAPDGERLAYSVTGSAGHALYVTNVMGGAPLRLVRDNNDQRAPAWSPDGAWIAFVENDGGKWFLGKTSSGGGDKAMRLRPLPGPCEPQWSPKGDAITAVTEEGLVLVAADGSTTRALGKLAWLAHGWSKDGASIYGIVQLANRHRAVAVVDMVRGVERVVGELPVAAATAVLGFSLSPEGDRFATSLGRTRADIWMLEGFEPPRLLERLRRLQARQ